MAGDKRQGRGWARGVAGIVFGCAAFVISGCGGDSERVVLYTSQDQVYSEPVVARFNAQSEFSAGTVYDSEAVKTVGLANRLIAEQDNPQADVFWSNEELRTRQLIALGVLEAEEWTKPCYRTRRIVINTNLIDSSEAPSTFGEMTNQVWRGKFAMAYPQFGTTATHFLALRQVWGQEGWLEWCRALEANEPMLVDGNSVVVKMVGAGEVPVGFTDSDDIEAGRREGLPVVSLPVPEDSLVIHNTVAKVVNGPNPAAAERLYEYLASDEVSDILIENDAAEGTEPPANVPRLSEEQWAELVGNLQTAVDQLSEIFLR